MLSESVLRWVAEAVGSGATVESVARLHGGTSSTVLAVTLRDGAGISRDCVLRLFSNAEWLREEPDLARHEAESLRYAEARTGLPTPRLVACDETGAESGAGVPALLMTRLVGTVVLDPADPARWLRDQAQALARIHAADAADFPWAYFSYKDPAALEVPTWSRRTPAEWEAAFRIVRGPRPAFPPCFVHRDYHPVNVLWADEAGATLSGVVDWPSACRGPAGADVGHCRVNLAQLYGVAAADAFLAAYEAAAAGPQGFAYDPYWDLAALADVLFGPPTVYPGWTAFGVTGLTDALMCARTDAYLARLLERV